MKLEINEFEKFKIMWKFNNTLLYKQCTKEDITRENRNYFDMNENGDITKLVEF